MSTFDRLKRRQVDEALEPFRTLSGQSAPAEGWARAVRTALGITTRQMAERLELSQTSVVALEQNEASGGIRLNSLRGLAEGLGCELVYALVPKASLEDVLRQRAREVAARLVSSVSVSMELEDQGVPAEDRERQIEELAGELLREGSSRLWDEP